MSKKSGLRNSQPENFLVWLLLVDQEGHVNSLSGDNSSIHGDMVTKMSMAEKSMVAKMSVALLCVLLKYLWPKCVFCQIIRGQNVGGIKMSVPFPLGRQNMSMGKKIWL